MSSPTISTNPAAAHSNRLANYRTVIVATAIAAAWQLGPSIAISGTLRTVALSGRPAPGTPAGASFSSFGAYYVWEDKLVFRGPVINDTGKTAFRANLVGRGAGVDLSNNQGIWSEGAGSLSMVARTGSAAPGAPDGVNFAQNPALELFTPVLNNDGKTAFYGGLNDGRVGLWSEGAGNLSLVALDGQQAAGAPDGVNHSFDMLRDFSPNLPTLNDAGQTAFWANLAGDGVSYANDWGVWSERSGSLDLVARSGSPAPGMPEGVYYDSLFIQTGFNDDGQTAYFAFVTGEGVSPANDQGIWAERSGGPELVVRSGDPAPGTVSGVNFREFYYTVTINNAGQTAFQGWLAGDGVDETNDEGLWSEGSGTLSLVARRGDHAPGTPEGVNFDTFGFSAWAVLNDAGQTAFRAELAGNGVDATNSRGIWVETPEGLELVARTGDQAPGTIDGVEFGDVFRPSLNSAGQTAFRGNLVGPDVNTNNDLGIWATDATGGVRLIVRTGAQLEVGPDALRTVSDVAFVGDTGNGDGRASGFNNRGQLVFWARFTDGSEGVFVSGAVVHLPGDTNADGVVDVTDLNNVRNNYGASGLGDTNGDNVVDVEDLNSVRNHFGTTALTPVPEPSGIFLSAIGVALFGVRLLTNSFARTLMNKTLNRNHRRTGQRRVYVALALLVSAALTSVAAADGLRGTIHFDASRKSPEVIPYTPNQVRELYSHYVSGRVPTNVQGAISGTNINTMLGADTFYSHGFTGTNAVIANIESGHIWSEHETLKHVLQIPNHSSALNEIDRHATWVGMVLAGRSGGTNPGAYQEGMAPDAQLYSGALASQYRGQRYALGANFMDAVVFDQYRRAFNTGVNAEGRPADVINSSWGGYLGSNGTDPYSMMADGFSNMNPRTLFVVAAGNSGPGPDQVWSPGAAFNNMSVGALGPNPPYDRPAFFTSGGPSDYADPHNGTVNDAQQMVDIAAPGENLSSAYYGGETGGNGLTDNPAMDGPGPFGLPNGSLGGPDYYSRGGLGGTSFAAPTVAGGAALLYDAAYSVFAGNDDARDARVMKSVLMNSADKTVGWDNGQVAHPNGNGGVLTTQGLDNRVGTGRMNLDAAYDQFLSGTTDVAGASHGNLGAVDTIGWDFGEVAFDVTNDYYFAAPLAVGSTFTATLTWFRDRFVDSNNVVFDDSFDDLNLELWSVADGAPASLISESASLFNSSEHFSFPIPTTGDYALRVRWFDELFDAGRSQDANQELYGLAWSVRPPFSFLAGDTDLDGDVDIIDLNYVRNHFGSVGEAALGDTNGDATVDLADLVNVRNAFGASAGRIVPEPGSFVLLLILSACGVVFMRR